MEIVLRILKSPLIRLLGAFAILYYALFANTYEKDSLGNRLSKKAIDKNLEEAKKNSLYIASNIKQAQDYKQNQSNYPASPVNQSLNPSSVTSAGLIIKDIGIGQGKEVKCGDRITANYIIYDNNGKKLDSITNYTIEINQNSAKSIVKENIPGLKIGGKRLIIIPANYKPTDEETSKYIALSNSGINYEIELLKIDEAVNFEAKCNWSN